MLIIGLTGGIGSGKSTVASAFHRLGVPIIDTDELSRQVTEPGTPGLAAIVQHFGKGILKPDHTLNRALLRKTIFDQPAERVWLEKLLHPIIWNETCRQISDSCGPYCIVVIPLLTEFERHPMIQRILVIDATPSQQMQRTLKRDQHAAGHVPAILKAQSTREKRLQLADDVISNDGTPEDLEVSVKFLHKKYLKLAQKKSGNSEK